MTERNAESRILAKASCEINARFKLRPSFIPFRVTTVGSFLAIRCEGPILTDLAHDVACYVRDHCAALNLPIDPAILSCGWFSAGTVINFRLI